MSILENKDQEFTSISNLGEFGLIDQITKDITHYHETTVKGVGDDAAVLNLETYVKLFLQIC